MQFKPTSKHNPTFKRTLKHGIFFAKIAKKPPCYYAA